MRRIELTSIDSRDTILKEFKKQFPDGTINEKGFKLDNHKEHFSYDIIDFFGVAHFALLEGTLAIDTQVQINPSALKSLVVRFILESQVQYNETETTIGEGLENGASLYNTYSEQNILLPKNNRIKWLGVHIPIKKWNEFTGSKWPILDKIIENKDPWTLFENMTPKFSTLLKDIFTLKETTIGKNGLIAAKSIELVTHFFIQLQKRNTDKESYGIPDVEIGKIFEIKGLLTKNIENPPDMDTLSKIFAMSKAKLRTNFKKVFGMPPYQYVIRERLNEAYRLLETSNRSLTDIALSLGFNDQSHFTKSFKNTFDCLPSSVR